MCLARDSACRHHPVRANREGFVNAETEDDDAGYAERTAQRLRRLADTRTGLEDADPLEVRRRLESTMYGGSRRPVPVAQA